MLKATIFFVVFVLPGIIYGWIRTRKRNKNVAQNGGHENVIRDIPEYIIAYCNENADDKQEVKNYLREQADAGAISKLQADVLYYDYYD